MPRRTRPSSSLLPLVLAGAVLTAGAAQAQTVYRCGPNGNVYAQQPCADGRPIDVGDARSPEQHEQARQLQRREQALADQLARDRRAFSAAHPAHAPAGIRSRPPGTESMQAQTTRGAGKARRPTTNKPVQRQEQPDFIAVAPGSARQPRLAPR